MNSRWQASKIGLINFWYYDEQEYPFVKGRMLLRGANGSGKSVTMQSMVPLLLDGNMSPERLDPFGSRDRKMSSYLLEEEDERRERTGYLYLEFKRKDSSTYLTIGMGIRAVRGKALDKWYFVLSDGRRVGKDFPLYKEMGEKITLSRKELENRIGEGGHVFVRREEYMAYVNRHIFGFETVEEYKEMIDLLIQLRTPKLSKDFKPSVINEILSDSLQPLSDEELQPMAEAIEHMDMMNLNLKARAEGLQAAEKIRRVLGKYDRLMLYRKAEAYLENEKALEQLQKEAAANQKEAAQCREEYEGLEKEQYRLNAKKQALEKELESLRASDAVELNGRKLRLESQIKLGKERLGEKERKLAEKEDRRVETEAKYKEEESREYLKFREIGQMLEEMQDEAEEMSFQEHAFFQEELMADLKEELSFATHKKQFEETRERIRQGRDKLEKAELQKEQAEEALKRRDRHQRETDIAQKRVTELEDTLIQVREQWKEHLYAWNGRNQELRLPEDLLREFASFADLYGRQSDFAEIKNETAEVYRSVKGRIQTELRQKTQEKEEMEREKREVEAERREWEAHREPEPARSEAVLNNRRHLQEEGIPYQEFYKLVEFGASLDQESCNRLEEALLEMGILDALVIEGQYKEKVLAIDEGCCDKYLFAGKARAGESILDVLELDESVNDIFLNQRITGILSGIGYCTGETADSSVHRMEGNPVHKTEGHSVHREEEAHTVIRRDGSYRIGALEGTVTGCHEAGFVGAQARERNRQAQIERCRLLLEEMEEKLEACGGIIQGLEGRMALLEEEYRAFPGDQDMRTALQMLEEGEQKLKIMKEEGARLEQQYRQIAEAWKESRKEALALAEKLYLECSLEVFRKAGQAADAYHAKLLKLESEHEMYRHIVLRLEELNEQMEILDADMDDIRYEKRDMEGELEKQSQELASVAEQLKLTDYEQIRERLDYCMAWLEQFQDRMNGCTEAKTRKQERMNVLKELRVSKEKEIEICSGKQGYLETCFAKERGLGYVTEEETSAVHIRQELAPECEKADRDEIVRSLNEVYFENRMFLNEYQPRQTEVLQVQADEVPEGCAAPGRIDITVRYQGVQMPFVRLTDCLKQEIEELKNLIKAGDRELFEDILANTVSRKIRGKINSSNAWVEKMNTLMGGMDTSSGLQLSLRWRSKNAETEEQLDTKELVELLKKDYRIMREDEAERLSRHFRSKVDEARRRAEESGGAMSFYQVMKDTLDYRKWFEFQLFSRKQGEKQKELTNSVFGTFSGGEKAMAMYVPLFSAVTAKYQGGSQEAPRLICLDEAFAGVDNRNIRDMFRLMAEFEFDFIINSQVLWGDADTLDALAIYQLIRPGNAKFVTVMPYLWNGKKREMLESEKQLEDRVV